jgi:hypothetical protein
MSNEVLSKFLEVLIASIITMAVPALVALAAVWLRQKAASIKTRLPENVLWMVGQVAGMVVDAAEQTGAWAELLETGEAKKKWAMERGEAILRETLGLSLDLDKLGDNFWAAVLTGLNAGIEQKVLEAKRNDGFAKLQVPPT